MLQGYVSHLRRLLEPGRVRGEHEILVSRPPGYMLQIRPDQLDAERFRQLTNEGRRLLDEGDADAAAERLHAALALWRGPALADLEYEPFARPEVDRLEELRLGALEDRIDADLALGRHDIAVGELRELVAKHPLRERLRAQLMLALYRSGRQADALEVYRDGRRTLDEELGVEPGPALRDLEQAILRHDPALGAAQARFVVIWRNHRRFGLAAAAFALAAAVLAAALTFGGSPGPIVVRPHSVAAIDPGSNEVVADIAVGGYPGPITADDKYVYVCNIGDATYSIIIPEKRALQGTAGFSRAIDLVAVQGYLWAANGGSPGATPEPPGTVTQSRAGVPVARIRLGPSRDGPEEQTTIATDAHGFEVWAGNQDSETVTQIVPSSRGGAGTVPGIAPGGLAVVEAKVGDTVWASDPSRNLVVRIDGNAKRVVDRITIPDQPTRLAAGDGAVWVTTRGRNPAAWRIDMKTNRPTGRIPLPVTPSRVAVGEGSVWISGNRTTDEKGFSTGGIVVRIDAKTERVVAQIPLGQPAVDGIVVSHGLVWVAVPPTA